MVMGVRHWPWGKTFKKFSNQGKILMQHLKEPKLMQKPFILNTVITELSPCLRLPHSK